MSFATNSVVSVECWDTDPKFAKQIADAFMELAIDYFDRISQRKEGLVATRKQLVEIDAERKMITDSMANLRAKHGIYILQQPGDAVSNILANKMKTDPEFHTNYDKVRSMETYIATLELRYGDLRRELMARELNMEQYPSLLWVTERPSESKFKDRPKRSIIVILAVLASFVFACFLILALDRSKDRLPV